MDIWEANSISEAYTAHSCAVGQQTRCEGVDCGDTAKGERFKGVCDKKYGQTTTNLSTEQRKAWAMAMPNVAKAWAERQDKAGLPGTKMLASFMDYMRANNQVVLRNWDKE